MYLKKINPCIVINSLVYFLLAYFFVAFLSNLVLIAIAKFIGFDAILSYNGFVLSGAKWTNDNIIAIYFFGNLISLIMALLFRRIYYIERKSTSKIKIFYLWLYIISISWFMGEIIIGALFHTGIGAALIAFRVPFMFRFVLAIVGILVLLFIGKKAQKHVMHSANSYFTSITSHKIGVFFANQFLLPTVLGFLVIVLFKLPNISRYNYVDLYMLLSIGFVVMGLLLGYGQLKSITFYSRNSKKLLRPECRISYKPIALLVFVILLIRVGLMNGINF